MHEMKCKLCFYYLRMSYLCVDSQNKLYSKKHLTLRYIIVTYYVWAWSRINIAITKKKKTNTTNSGSIGGLGEVYSDGCIL